MVVENKSRQLVPFTYNDIQADAYNTQTGMDIWIKPAQVGFSTERIANRLVDTLINPGTNTILVAYEEVVTGRLLSKVSFFYNHLMALGIPNFPEIHHDSQYEKTFRFYVDGRVHSTSSIYITSARSYVAGRAQTLHHLLFDEFAFYPPGAMESIVSPALDRLADDGTCDIYSTPNGESNAFYDMYQSAKAGKSVFTPHFYSWWLHKEYVIRLGDIRIDRFIPETNCVEFKLSPEEENLVVNKGLSFDQIRWRRWKIKEKESLKSDGQFVLLFQQEYPEDDSSCFLSTGDMYFDKMCMDNLVKTCYPAKFSKDSLNIWYQPEKGRVYVVAIDPGQAKVTQSAIVVITYDMVDGNYIPRICARDAGYYSPEMTAKKAVMASDYYNRAMIAWEANSHGMAITELLKHRRPIYLRKDIISGQQSLEPGWLTTSKNKDYMLQNVARCLPDLICHDLELVNQMKHYRLVGDKIVVTGLDDIFMAFAIGLMCFNPKPFKRGLIVSRTGWRW